VFSVRKTYKTIKSGGARCERGYSKADTRRLLAKINRKIKEKLGV
jgi:hypothetical protein